MAEFKHGRTGYLRHKCRCDICREANRLYRRQHRENQVKLELPKLPGAPLVRLLELDGQLEALNPAYKFRWLRYGLSVYSADVMAVKFGYHPYEVWGDDFYVGCDVA